MNCIELQLLLKDNDNPQTNGWNSTIQVNTDSVTYITPELILKQNPKIDLDDVYSVNAKIVSDSKSSIVISNFNYFTLESSLDTDIAIRHLKVSEIIGLFKLNKIKIERVDIENSNALLVDCDVGKAYLGLENYFENMDAEENDKELKYNIDIRNCKINRLKTYSHTDSIRIHDSVLKRLVVQSGSERLLIDKYSELGDLILSKNISSIKLDNSSIKFIQGTSSLLINKFEMDYSVISNTYNIFENNLLCKNEESYDLIRSSYRQRKDYDHYAAYSYMINKIYLKDEKHMSSKIPLMILDITCGFGYRLANTIRFSSGVIILFSIVYFLLTCFGGREVGINIPEGISLLSEQALYSLYHSIVTFATLGYGDTVGRDWFTKFLSAAESILGIYSMSVIVYTLTKKYSSFK